MEIELAFDYSILPKFDQPIDCFNKENIYDYCDFPLSGCCTINEKKYCYFHIDFQGDDWIYAVFPLEGKIEDIFNKEDSLPYDERFKDKVKGYFIV